MDTDELFEEARVIFSTAYEISDFLRADIVAIAKKYENENDYLDAVHKFVKSIAIDQSDYLDDWMLEERLDQRKLIYFVKQIEEIRNIPQNNRTYYEY